MLEKITRIVGIGFAVYWLIFTSLEYWEYHDAARRGLQYFQYYGLAAILLVLGGLLVFVYTRFGDKPSLRYFSNGLGLVLICTLIALISVNGFFYKNLGAFLSLSEDLTLLVTLFGIGGAVLLVILTAYAAGRHTYRLFDARLSSSSINLIYVAVGIIMIVAVLFLLGLFGLLFSFILWPLVFFVLITSWRSLGAFLKVLFWETIPALRQFSVLGWGVGYLLLLLITMNYVQVTRPFPTGFDALTYYVNIASLVDDYKGLVYGFGAYNWSLFIALGYLLFGKTSVTLTMAFLGGILSLFALFSLSRKWLSADYSLLVVLLFYSLPMISWLSYRDMKVDMGLLFFSILIVDVFMEWLQPAPSPQLPKKVKAKKKKKESVPSRTERLRQWISAKSPSMIRENPRLVLLGLFTGFAIGIKFSALIILLALVPAISYAKGNRLAFAAWTTLMLGTVLLARFDDQAALRPLHLLADQLQWILLLTGLLLAGLLFFRHREIFVKVFRMSLICTLVSICLLSPWLIKNAVETQSLSTNSLTSGENAGPKPSIPAIRQAYENRTNGQ